MSKIKEILWEKNPWWKGSFEPALKDREIYGQIMKFMPLPQIVALTGIRRVGKTSLMLKIVADYVRKGFEPQRIIYFSFDDFEAVEIRAVIGDYEKTASRDLKEGSYLLLLDEIQKLKNWENQLKSIYDSFGKTVKIVISGSESLFIRRRSKETLAGRLFEFKVEPLTFKEFLAFKGMDLKPVGIYERELSRLFEEFSLSMGFPELVGVSDHAIIRKYIMESIVEKVLYRDMAGLFQIRDISALRSLLSIIMNDPGQIIKISELSKELNISRLTLSNYLSYLEDSFLVLKLYNYSANVRKTERKLRRYYPKILSPDLLFRDDDYSKSKVFEWMIVTQLKAEFFWRDPYKNEVDVVMANKGLTPIEIKYGKLSFDGLLAFMNKFKINRGFIITSETEQVQRIGDKTLLAIPAFKFLLKEDWK